MAPTSRSSPGYLAGNPVGGHVLSILHWLAGLRSLGYDVVFVEHHGWPDACWNPAHQDAERRSRRTASTSWRGMPSASG